MITTDSKGNSSIPVFDTNPIQSEVCSTSSSELNFTQSSPLISRLPSFKHNQNRQRLSLTTRKCISSNVTPISSPIVPRSINNNFHPPAREFSKDVIESSAKLINDIDVTLSQLSKQYYSDNNNLFEANSDNSIIHNAVSPMSLQNNNFTNLASETFEYKPTNRLRLQKSSCPTKRTQEPSVVGMSQPAKPAVEINNKHQDLAYYPMNKESIRKPMKYSSRRAKSSKDDNANSNVKYTEAWIYNTHQPSSMTAANELITYMSNSDCKNFSQSNLPIYQKSIFAQHRHQKNHVQSPSKYNPKIPVPTGKLRSNKDEDSTNRDSGIYLSCSKDGSSDGSNNNIVQIIQPQPPPRISSLISASQNAGSRCQSIIQPVSKSDRRKAKELFTSLKQKQMEDTVNDGGKETAKCQVGAENVTAEGYCSDMDNLKNSGYLSDHSGYLSEGTLGGYAHKIQQRFHEGLLAVQESLDATTPRNKIVAKTAGNLGKEDVASTSSEEIEDYLRQLSSRLIGPSTFEEVEHEEAESKSKMYEERLEKYGCDVGPSADFDITSSCSMDLLTGKTLSDVGSEDDSLTYRGVTKKFPELKATPRLHDYGKRKSSMDSCLRASNVTNNKMRSGFAEILECAGPSPAIFDGDSIDDGSAHYRALSLPGRPRCSGGWQSNTASMCPGDPGYMYSLLLPPPTLPTLPLPSPQSSSSEVYYDVPMCRPRPGRTGGSSTTPSLLNVRLPYATGSQQTAVKNSLSTTSLGKKDSDSEEIYDGLGSHLSLLSTSSYRSLNEERQATEIRKLRRELEVAQSKVRTLSGQLSNNGTLVTAFEGTLQSMSLRLQRFAASSESKESELNELKSTIESLKRQAGASPIPGEPNLCSSKIYSSSSLTSLSSNSPSNEKRTDGSIKKSSWFKTSLGRAFRKKSTKYDGSTESINDVSTKNSARTQTGAKPMASESESLKAMQKELEEKDARLTDVQLDALSRSHQLEQLRDQLTKMRYEMSSLKADNSRLQCLMTTSTGAVSLQSMDQSLGGEGADIGDPCGTLKAISHFKDINAKPRFDFLNGLVKDTTCCRPVMVSIALKNRHRSIPTHTFQVTDGSSIVPIGRVGISAQTSWSDLEADIRRLLKEYLDAVDPGASLGLSSDLLMAGYQVSHGAFITTMGTGGMRPLTSPLAAISNSCHPGTRPSQDPWIQVSLEDHSQGPNSVDEAALQSLIPKPILARYIGLLMDHRRIILSGPSGTGKSYLAHLLAGSLAARFGRDPASSILVFSLDLKSCKELRSYMTTLTDHLLKSDPHSDMYLASNIPLVIVLDNLHHVTSFSDIFNSFLSIHHTRSPFVIGTMNQLNSTASNNLQLHHNFRWVLCTNHMEPVKGFLGRYLRREFQQYQLESEQSLDELYHVIEWISIVWQHINKFLETYCTPDVTIGPRLFLNCPMNVEKSKAWFLDLWNYSLVPYVLDAVRDGLNTHGRRLAAWEDPTDWIVRSWPWPESHQSVQINACVPDTSHLIRLRPEDVGFDSYPLVTTRGTFPVPGLMCHDSAPLGSGRHSLALDRRSRTYNTSDHSDPFTAMCLKMHDKVTWKK